MILDNDVFVLQESSFEKIFNHYEKSKNYVNSQKTNIENWNFIDKPDEFFTNATSTKGSLTKLARALEKSHIDFANLNPTDVRNVSERHSEFSTLTFDENDRICYTPAARDIIIDILRHSYTRDLFSENLIKTKGV